MLVEQILQACNICELPRTTKKKVQQLGFGQLLQVQNMRLPREMLVPILRAYDPSTNQFRIRGKTTTIEATDVAQLLGVPDSGEEVTMNVIDTDPVFLRLRKEYGKMKYNEILKVITEGKWGDQFEMLFMMHLLGTFLVPTSSTTPSLQLLKVLAWTSKGFARFDWATYVSNDLRNALTYYVNAIRKNKDCNSYVGGCIYMLLLLFGERFPIEKAVQHKGKSPIQFWTKEKVREMMDKEKKSNIGILYATKAGQDKAKKDTPERSFVASLDPVFKAMHDKLMGIINDNHKKLVLAVEDELRKAQDDIGRQREQQVGEAEDDSDEADDNGQDGEGDDEGQEGEGDGHDEGDGGYDEEASVRTPIDIDELNGESPTVVGETNEGQQSIVPDAIQQEDAPRRSERPKKPKNMSPWTLIKPLKRPRKAKEQKEMFFDLISGSCTKDEGEKILLQIDDEDITREQLQTLGRRNRLSNRVMSVVCKTLMKDMQNQGEVKRHIFSADHMNLLARKPPGWNVAEWKEQLLLEFIGYNIGDCELMMGPVLVDHHWFCIAIDPRTKNFYVLDSMKTNVVMSKNEPGKKKKTALANPQATTIKQIRDRFEQIIELVKPNDKAKMGRSEICWPFVPQQPNLQDCGVHVLI